MEIEVIGREMRVVSLNFLGKQTAKENITDGVESSGRGVQEVDEIGDDRGCFRVSFVLSHGCL